MKRLSDAIRKLEDEAAAVGEVLFWGMEKRPTYNDSVKRFRGYRDGVAVWESRYEGTAKGYLYKANIADLTPEARKALGIEEPLPEFPCWTLSKDRDILRYWFDASHSIALSWKRDGVQSGQAVDVHSLTAYVETAGTIIPESEAIERLMPKCVDCGALGWVVKADSGRVYLMCSDNASHSTGPLYDTPLKAILGYLRIKVDGINTIAGQ